MNSQTYYKDFQVRKMIERFNRISGKDNTKISVKNDSMYFACDCGCIKVDHFAVSRKDTELYKKHFVELCNTHKLEESEMKNRTVFQIEINGNVLPEEYGTHEDAIKATEALFENDKTVTEAEVMKVTYEDVLAVRNKKK